MVYPAKSSTKPEVVKVRAQKGNGGSPLDTKVFSLDPAITGLQSLRQLLRVAFRVEQAFVISYLLPYKPYSSSSGAFLKYMPIVSEWDLQAALMQASDECLYLKIDLKPLDGCLEDWDILEEDDVERCRNEYSDEKQALHPEAAKATELGGRDTRSTFSERLIGRLQKSLLNKESAFEEAGSARATKKPMTDAEFSQFLAKDGTLLYPDRFRLSVYQGGIERSLRPVAWRHLLSVYPNGLNGSQRIAYTKRLCAEYSAMKMSWQSYLKSGLISEHIRSVVNMVWKDVVRTDRTLDFYASEAKRRGGLEGHASDAHSASTDNRNVLSLFNLLTTWALSHPSVSYCQGMSDLASPILVVMKDEGEAYICFCALMKQLGFERNFAFDGKSMTRKFQHLGELLQHYDPVFFEYLRECHADDLLFCYRWLLLGLKREFAFDSALLMLEVMWSSLIPNPPKDDQLQLYAVDISNPSMNVFWTNGSGLPYLFHGRAKGTTPYSSKLLLQSLHCVASSLDRSKQSNLSPPSPPSPIGEEEDAEDNSSVESGVGKDMDMKRSNAIAFERQRGHLDSDCDKTLTGSYGQGDEEPGEMFDKLPLARGPPSCELNDLPPPDIIVSEERSLSDSIKACDAERTKSLLEPLEVDPGFFSEFSLENRSIDPSEEMEILDNSEMCSTQNNSPTNVAVAQEAGSAESELNGLTVDEHCELSLTDIQDIITNASLSVKSSESVTPRSRHMSTETSHLWAGNCSSDTAQQQGSNSSASAAPGCGLPWGSSGESQKSFSLISRYVSSENAAQICDPDSGVSSILPGEVSHSEADTYSRTHSVSSNAERQLLLSDSEFVSLDKDPKSLLPPPNVLGDGHPFMMFLCLTLLLLHRDHIMRHHMDYNDIAIYFDKLVRKHDVHKVLYRARILYSDYLRSCESVVGDY